MRFNQDFVLCIWNPEQRHGQGERSGAYLLPIFTTRLGSSMMPGLSTNCWYDTACSKNASVEQGKGTKREGEEI